MNEIVLKVEGLLELTQALQALAASLKAGAPLSVQPTAQTPVQPQMPVPVSVPAQQTTGQPQPLPVASAPVQSTVPVQVPVTESPVQYSFDQLAVAASNLCTAGKQAEVLALLSQFGVQAMFDLPRDRYGDMATALRSIGGVI